MGMIGRNYALCMVTVCTMDDGQGHSPLSMDAKPLIPKPYTLTPNPSPRAHARSISQGRASPDVRAPSPDILEGARNTPLSISRLLLLPQTSPPAPSPPLQPSSS